MTDDRYTRCNQDGTPNPNGKFDLYTIYNLRRAEAKLGYSLTIVQGGYNRGGVAASAGTHDAAAVVDLLAYDYKAKVKALRSCGFAAWYRPPNWDGRGGGAHIHAVLIGNDKASAGAKSQVSAYKRFRNGLANNAVDLSWHPLPIKSAPYAVKKPTTLRVATFNFPGPDKLPNAAGRIKSMLRLVGSQKLHVIGWNELVGIKAPGQASDFAHDVDAALGSKWRLVKPTLRLNENYISYRGDVLTLVHQYDDSILEARTGGRHLTRAVFRYKDGFTFAVGQTHLVNDGGSQGERDRQTQAADALESMKAVSAKHGNCPWIIQGDMNTAAELTALAKVGKRTRKYADKSTTRNAATYTNYAKTVPSTSLDWVIDQQYVSGFYVVAYNVIRDLVRGSFRKPRASDHDLVVTEIRSS